MSSPPKSENPIELAKLASLIDSAMHDEIFNDDDPLAKVKGLINDMITMSEEKAFADDTHNATHSAFEAKHILNSMHSEIEPCHRTRFFFDDLDDFTRVMQLA